MSRRIIPDQLCSEGTIKYVGFEETKAAQLWEIFSRLSDRTQRETFSWPRPSKIELVDFLTNSVC
ncbi:unnamed protein product [Fusarium graminearum]|nr:unnamed protein product [Fusarium graminearum]